MKLEISNIKDVDNSIEIKPEGRIDYYNLDYFKNEIDPMIDIGTKNIVIHLDKVDFISAEVFRYLIEIHCKLLTRNGKLKLIKPTQKIKWLIKLSGVKKFLRIYNSYNEIISDLKFQLIETLIVLEIFEKNNKKNKKSIELDKNKKYILGRNINCDIKLEDNYCSSKHCEIYFDKNNWMIKDLDSTNGTYLNDKKIKLDSFYIKDTIKIGKSLIMINK